jgi:Transcription factor WhiB
MGHGRGKTARFFSTAADSVECAKATCVACPVRLQCLRTALEDASLQGVWGGYTEAQRKQLRRRWRGRDSERTLPLLQRRYNSRPIVATNGQR